MARPKSPNPETRTRILAAACDEFGAHGFDATTVDRIARRARVNKAMIYYHFSNKRALYTCIIQNVFAPITAGVRATISEGASPGQNLERVIETLVRSVDGSTYFLPIFLREVADGGAHLGPEELTLLAGIFAAVSGVVSEGAKQGVFRTVHPALAHFTIIGPLVMFRASAPMRARIKTMRQVHIPDADSDTLVRHLQMVAQGMLAPTDAPQRVGEREEGRGKREGGGQRAEREGQRAEGKEQRAERNKPGTRSRGQR
jgi:TetR/AcrR family transcriptional regulator